MLGQRCGNRKIYDRQCHGFKGSIKTVSEQCYWHFTQYNILKTDAIHCLYLRQVRRRWQTGHRFNFRVYQLIRGRSSHRQAALHPTVIKLAHWWDAPRRWQLLFLLGHVDCILWFKSVFKRPRRQEELSTGRSWTHLKQCYGRPLNAVSHISSRHRHCWSFVVSSWKQKSTKCTFWRAGLPHCFSRSFDWAHQHWSPMFWIFLGWMIKILTQY